MDSVWIGRMSLGRRRKRRKKRKKKIQRWK
jgi:hypothetical protein